MESPPPPRRTLPLDARAALLLYNLFFPFVLLCLLPNFAVRMLRRGKYRHKFGQRFGIYSTRVKSRIRTLRAPTWIHAVSVGEVLIALKLILRLRQLDAQSNIVLSTTTSTGFALARKSAPSDVEVIYNPLDFPMIVTRVLNLIRPVRFILVEAEVWPNLVAGARRRGAQLALVNARLSARSERRFYRYRAVTGPIFRMLDLVCVQEPEEITRWQTLGVPPARIHCTGSIKFDEETTPPTRLAEFRKMLRSVGVAPEAPVLLAASTHAGEEQIIARIFHELRTHRPNLFLILVPRHVERTSAILEELAPLGLRISCRSAIDPTASTVADCLLVDTTGELRDWFHLGTVIFIGKSFTASGGQNPVEAIVAGKPVVFGPHMENFHSIVRLLLARNAALQAPDVNSLHAAIAHLLRNPDECGAQAARAREVLAVHRGATARTAQLLAPADA